MVNYYYCTKLIYTPIHIIICSVTLILNDFYKCMHVEHWLLYNRMTDLTVMNIRLHGIYVCRLCK